MLNSFSSLEKRNLLPAGPQITAVFSLRILVLKMSGEHFRIQSPTNFTESPERNSTLSPRIGQPKLPGGNLALPAEEEKCDGDEEY